LIVIHDSTLDRTTDAVAKWGGSKIRVGDKTLAELHTLDAGKWFDPQFAGTRLPTPTAALEVIQDGNMTLIERKGGDAKTLIKLLEDKKLLDQVVVQAFDWKFVAECRRLSPRVALCTLSDKPPNLETLQAAAATGADVIVWNHEKIGPTQIKQIHALGKKAWVYTVDEETRATALIAAGIDGIITNKPAEMLAIAQKSQARP